MTQRPPIVAAQVAALCSQTADRLQRAADADWIRDQLLTLAGFARYAPERWPTTRYTTAVLAIAAGDKHWRATASEPNCKEG
ncbi:MAG TPA: hypothetical protein VFQ42_21935 [Mycobacterium sp.]|nr:hypothetical protein [Mycobacterium sp.]